VSSPLPPANLDPALDLAAVLDPDRVARRFARRWPDVTACALEHARWSPGVECVTSHRLALAPAGDGARFTIGVVTVTPDGVRHRLFAEDPALPGVAAALDTTAMRAWLSERVGRRVGIESAAVVRYRAGSRCVIRYRLTDAAHTTVYGKLLCAGEFDVLASAARALGDLAAPLVGVDPTLRLVVQGDAGDRSLAALGADPASLARVRSGGALLARLHGPGSPGGAPRTLDGDVEALRLHLPSLGRVSAPAAALAAEGTDRLARIPPVRGLRPAHGAFRLDQVHLGAAGASLIDLDSYCRAEPARDLGNALAYLRWRAIRRPDAAADAAAIAAALLDGYAERAPSPVDGDRLAIHEAAALLKIAGRRCQRLAVAEWEHLETLVSAALERLATPAGQKVEV
jgi:hypothetical protein